MSLRAAIVAYDQAAAAAAAAAAITAPPAPAPSPVPALTSLAPSLVPDADDEDDDHSRSLSPFPESLASSSSLDAPDVLVAPDPIPGPCRPNEHLAVLIPRNLWKPDRLAARCDKYACRVKFSLFERKHHCRKCGGVFCHQCSARSTPLLDTTRLPFLLPPRGTPITAYASPNAPVRTARVCDDCFEQLHGYPTPRPRSASACSSTSLPHAPPPALIRSASSLSSLSPTTPPDIVTTAAIMRAHLPRHVKTTKLSGDLDRYPLKDPSATCKAAGGGRWSPTRVPQRWDARLPDGRFRFDAEADRRAAAQRRRQANPVIVDGPIRVRKPPHPPRNRTFPPPTF